MPNDASIRFDNIQDNFNVEEFIFTPKTLSYSGRTVQIRNITRVFLYDVTRIKKPSYRFSWGAIFLFMLLCGLCVIVNANLGISDRDLRQFLAIATLITGLISLFGLLERLFKSTKSTTTFGLVIETAGGAENLVSKDEEFAKKLFKQITIAMNKEEFQPLVANFRTGDINFIDNTSIQTGDVFENITNAEIVNRSVLG